MIAYVMFETNNLESAVKFYDLNKKKHKIDNLDLNKVINLNVTEKMEVN